MPRQNLTVMFWGLGVIHIIALHLLVIMLLATAKPPRIAKFAKLKIGRNELGGLCVLGDLAVSYV